jgi:ABC-type Fe3+ transport system permease subunit
VHCRREPPDCFSGARHGRLVGFISAARDIGTVVLLGSGRSRTLSLLMLDFAAGAEFEKATVVTVMVVLLVVAAALLARIFGGNVGVRE